MARIRHIFHQQHRSLRGWENTVMETLVCCWCMFIVTRLRGNDLSFATVFTGSVLAFARICYGENIVGFSVQQRMTFNKFSWRTSFHLVAIWCNHSYIHNPKIHCNIYDLQCGTSRLDKCSCSFLLGLVVGLGLESGLLSVPELAPEPVHELEAWLVPELVWQERG